MPLLRHDADQGLELPACALLAGIGHSQTSEKLTGENEMCAQGPGGGTAGAGVRGLAFSANITAYIYYLLLLF